MKNIEKWFARASVLVTLVLAGVMLLTSGCATYNRGFTNRKAVLIDTVPSGAAVYVDRVLLPQYTPCMVKLSPGDHKITFKHPLCYTREFTTMSRPDMTGAIGMTENLAFIITGVGVFIVAGGDLILGSHKSHPDILVHLVRLTDPLPDMMDKDASYANRAVRGVTGNSSPTVYKIPAQPKALIVPPAPVYNPPVQAPPVQQPLSVGGRQPVWFQCSAHKNTCLLCEVCTCCYIKSDWHQEHNAWLYECPKCHFKYFVQPSEPQVPTIQAPLINEPQQSRPQSLQIPAGGSWQMNSSRQYVYVEKPRAGESTPVHSEQVWASYSTYRAPPDRPGYDTSWTRSASW